MQKAILFDLDDTLIDTRYRHFRVLNDFLKSQHRSFISFDEYVVNRLKSHKSNRNIVKEYFPQLTALFGNYWMENIEGWNYLVFDREIVDKNLLYGLRRAGIIFIGLSLRSNKINAVREFSGFSFSSLFEESVFLPHQSINPKTAYINQIKGNYNLISMVGDSLADLNAAKMNDIPFIGVKTGWEALNDCPLFENVNFYLNTLL